MVSIGEYAPFILGAARGLGCAVFLPLGWDIVGISQRISLALGFGFGLPVPDTNFEFVQILVFVTIGAVYTWPISLAADIAANAGELIDIGRGVMIAEVLDPLQTVTASHLSALARYSIWVCVLSSGGLDVLVPALARAHSIPILNLIEIGRLGLSIIFSMISVGFVAILPVLIAFLVAEVVVAVLSKISLNLSLSTEATILKLAVGAVLFAQTFDALRPEKILRIAYG